MGDFLKKEGLEWLKAFALGVLVFVIIRTFLFSSYIVSGDSMLPTLEEGNKLIVNKIGYQIGQIDRFDVIIFHAAHNEDYVKRVIGLPGDELEYRQDKLFVNGEAYEEAYLETHAEIVHPKKTGDFTLAEITGKTKVPEEMLFVLGDNRLGSLDSRHFGFISTEEVVGKVSIRYWPFAHFSREF